MQRVHFISSESIPAIYSQVADVVPKHQHIKEAITSVTSTGVMKKLTM